MSVISIAGGTQATSSASGGKVYAINNLGVAPQVVAPANSSRRKLTFHNPGTIDFYVAPAVTAAGTTLTPAVGSLGGCFVVFGNGGMLSIEGECQTAWQAFSASASNNPLTVMDSNI